MRRSGPRGARDKNAGVIGPAAPGSASPARRRWKGSFIPGEVLGIMVPSGMGDEICEPARGRRATARPDRPDREAVAGRDTSGPEMKVSGSMQDVRKFQDRADGFVHASRERSQFAAGRGVGEQVGGGDEGGRFQHGDRRNLRNGEDRSGVCDPFGQPIDRSMG
jgi:hypothetical protein